MEISLEDVANGTTKTIELNKLDKCNVCNGTGGELETCTACRGSGMFTQIRRTPFGLFQTSTQCKTCRSTGSSIKKACKRCHGEARIRVRKNLEIKIPAGIEEGTRLRIAGEGIMPEHGEPGDLFIIINIKEHPIFKRQYNNIMLEAPISFTQAILGDDIEVPILNGKAKLKIPPNTQNNTIFRMKNKGIKNAHGTGDQLVKVFIKIPDKMSKKQHSLIKELAKLEKEKPTSFFKKFF